MITVVRLLIELSVLLGMVCVVDGAHAATSTTFQVSASIQAGCSVDGLGTLGNVGTIGSIDFGQDTAVSTATHTATLTGQAVVLRCTPGVALSMTLDGGLHSASGVRYLQLGPSSADRLAYRLFRDASQGQEIGINQNQSITVTSANMNNIQFPIFGTLSLPGGKRIGTYTDQILVTLTW